MYQEIMQELSSLWTVAVRERDEASERLRHSLLELSQLQKLFNNILLSGEQQHVAYYYYPDEAAVEEPNHLQNCIHNHFNGNSPSPLDSVSSPSCDLSPAKSESASYGSSLNEKRRDFETVVLEMIGGVLPENGKFVQAVSEAGPLLESLLITGSVPKWRNPPVQASGQGPVMSNNYEYYSNTGNWSFGGLEFGSGMLNRSFPCKKARFSMMS